MTQHRPFKRLVRARMARTGESYTAARAQLLAHHVGTGPAAQAPETAPLPTSDDRLRERTGRGWEEWFDLLDDAGMHGRPHREVSRYLAGLQGVDPLAWDAQVVVKGYERARGGQEVGQHEDGFAVHVSRTVGAPSAQVLEAVADEGRRAGWLGDLALVPRRSTSARRLHFDVPDGGGRVHVQVDAKGEDRTTVSVEHARLAGSAAADAARAAWRGRLDALRALLEGGAR
jgi:hypothetical protein